MTTSELLDATPAQTHAWVENDTAVLIDVREPDEHARERIASAKLAPLSRFEPGKVPGNRAKIAVFHCASGNRTSQASERLIACGFERTFQLAGGIAAWRNAGLPTVVDRRAPLPLQRQVQIAAGTMIVVGTVLGWLVNPGWYALAGFVGAGLLTAGATGRCGMATLLTKMPWNRRENATENTATAGADLS